MQGLKVLFLRLVALLVVTASVAVPGTALAYFDGDYRLGVKLVPPRTDVTITATRKSTSVAPVTVTFHWNAGAGRWETDIIDRTNGNVCTLGSEPCTWSVSVKDATGKEIGNVPFTTVFGHDVTGEVAKTFTINVPPAPPAGGGCPAGSPGDIHGHATFIDYRDNNKEKNAPTNVTIDATQTNGTAKFTTAPDANGNYAFHNVPPGTYDIHLHGGYQDPQNISDGLPLDYTINVTVDACKDTPADIKVPLPADGGGTSGTPPEPPPRCVAPIAVQWIVCPIIRASVTAIDWIRDNIIVPFLQEKPLDKNGDAKTAYNIWAAFRNVASIFFILIFFLVIFGTAIGWDNYTVKKALPRLIAGAVFVPFSWYLCVALVDAGNILGQGLVALSSAIIPPADISLKSSITGIFLGTGAALGLAALTTAFVTVGLGVLFSMLIAFVAVFATLVFRKILILLLIILSPLAFVAWILPNTEKWFKEWWTNLFKLVMMYPLIMVLFEAGRLFAATAGATAGNAAEKGVTPLFQLVGLTLPLFMIPFTFSWAGTGLKLGQKAIGKAAGGLDKRVGKGSDFDKARAERRKAKAAASMTGRPVTWLGKKMQANPNSKLAGLSRRLARKRGGFGGAVVPITAANRRKAEMLAEKYFDDEAAADAVRETREEEMRSGQFVGSDTIIARRTEAQVAAIRAKRKTESGNIFSQAHGGSGLTRDDLLILAQDGGKLDGNAVGLPGQSLEGNLVQEAAIEALAEAGEYEKLRANWIAGRISNERLAAALPNSAISKARDMFIGAQKRINPSDASARQGELGGRKPEEFLGYDKSTRWEYLDRLHTLQQAGDRAGFEAHRAEVYKVITAALDKGGGSLDPKTLQTIRYIDEHGTEHIGEYHTTDAGGNPVIHDLGFSADQKDAIRGYFKPDGTIKQPVQQAEI